MTAVAQVENQIKQFSLSEQLYLLEQLAKAIKMRTEKSAVSSHKRYFGCAKGELHYPEDIDFCNDEIAEMFGASE